MKTVSILLLILSSMRVSFAEVPLDSVKPGEPARIHFDGAIPSVADKLAAIQYDYDLARESFEMFVPGNYSGREAYGLFVFMDSGDQMGVPREWIPLMKGSKLICLIPQRIGNEQPLARRLGLALTGILKMKERYQIDPKRVFVGGMSGGARCSAYLALLQGGLIAGDVSICGAGFYEPVPQVKATNMQGYGVVWPVPADRAAVAKARAGFVFITGPGDFRHGNILDIYEGGYVKNHFRARLIDVPGMGHELCTPETLQEAIRFLDERR